MDEDERKLWISVYETVIQGLYIHDKWNGLENIKAKESADKAVAQYREVSNG